MSRLDTGSPSKGRFRVRRNLLPVRPDGFRNPPSTHRGVGPIGRNLNRSILIRSHVGSPTQACSQSSTPVHSHPRVVSATRTFQG